MPGKGASVSPCGNPEHGVQQLDPARVQRRQLDRAIGAVARCAGRFLFGVVLGALLESGAVAAPEVRHEGLKLAAGNAGVSGAWSVAFLEQSQVHGQGSFVEFLAPVPAELQVVAQQQADKEAEPADQGGVGRVDVLNEPANKKYDGLQMLLLNLGFAVLGAFCSPIIGSRYDPDLGVLLRRWRARRVSGGR